MAVLNSNPASIQTPAPEVLGRMLDSAARAYLVFGSELAVVSRNLRARSLTGSNDVLGHRASEFLSADSVRALAGLPVGGASREVDLMFTASQEAFLIRCVAQKTDTFTHVVEISSEPSDARKQTEQALAASEARTLLVEQLIAAQENERAKVARELHDDSGQTFTALLVGLRSIRDAATLDAAKERAAELGTIASAAVASVGRVARGLHPSVLDSFGLVAAIQQAVTGFTSVYGIPVHLTTGGLKPHDLSPSVELTLYRVLQESLTNIAKHAAAKEVRVDISMSAGLARLSIRDDGVGFDVTKERAAVNKLGLRSMTERTALLGGLLRVESSASAGTTITVEVPLCTGAEGCKS